MHFYFDFAEAYPGNFIVFSILALFLLSIIVYLWVEQLHFEVIGCRNCSAYGRQFIF